MGLRTLLKNYQVILVLLVLFFSSCKSFHIKSSGPGNSSYTAADPEQKQLEREFKKLEKKAARQAQQRYKFKSKSRKAPGQQIEKVISTARSYRGTPYKYGGTTRIGMDCSGLLCQSF